MTEVKIKTSTEEYQETLQRNDCQLVMSMADLQLKYLFHILKTGAERDFGKALSGYTSIVSRMKSIPGFEENNDEWQTALTAVKKVYSGLSVNETSGKDFSVRALEILAPFLACSLLAPETPREWFGCFCYNYSPEIKHIYLHFKNACCPESPFADISARFRELAQIIEDIKNKGFSPETFGCDSWINELELVQGLFPPEYLQSFEVSPPDSKSGYGWWGQFVGKDGRFNAAKAGKFEKDMQFQYRRIIAKCSYESFIKHINSMISL